MKVKLIQKVNINQQKKTLFRIIKLFEFRKQIHNDPFKLIFNNRNLKFTIILPSIYYLLV